MTFTSVCNSCMEAFQLTLTMADERLLKPVEVEPGLVRCPRGCGGLINIVPIADLSKFRTTCTITAKELYEALHGNGLPDEIPTDADVVDSLLRANTVVTTEVERVGDCIYLHSVKLGNGLTIHLGGGMGPRVVKITKPQKEKTDGDANPG